MQGLAPGFSFLWLGHRLWLMVGFVARSRPSAGSAVSASQEGVLLGCPFLVQAWPSKGRQSQPPPLDRCLALQAGDFSRQHQQHQANCAVEPQQPPT